MAEGFRERLAAVAADTLTPMVRSDRNRPGLEVTEWSYRPLGSGMTDVNRYGYGTFRFSGRARDGDEDLGWTLILKAIGGRGIDAVMLDPESWNYWKREILAYRSGILAGLPAGLGTPRCHGVIEQPGDEFWIWLEEVRDDAEGAWSLERFALAARHLGRFNGSYTMGHPIPDAAWLTRGRVRNWMKLAEPYLEDLPATSPRSRVETWLSDARVERTLALWRDRGSLLAALDRLPRALCHHDAFRRNLLTRDRPGEEPETVAIDWQIVGTGALGEELAPLVGVSMQFFDFDIDRAADLDEAAFGAYLQGLEDVGWRGDPRAVRFGFSVACALFLGVGGVLWLNPLLDEAARAGVERVMGRPIEEVLDRFGLLQDYVLARGDEARALAEALG